MRSRDGGHDASPTGETRGRPSSHVPLRAERSTLGSHTLPLSQNETIRPQDRARRRPLNKETLSDRLALPTVPQRAADHPERPVERGEQDSEANPEENDARIDDEPLHREVAEAGAGAGVTTTREPVLGPHTTRVVERAQERDMVAETHFQSNLSCWKYWYVAGLYHTVSHNVNTMLLQCAPNLFNLLLIHANNANATVNLAITVLNNFELKRDTVQAKNYLPAQ